MKFSYQALDRAGKIVADTVEARDAAEAIEDLRRKNLFVNQISEFGRGGKSAKQGEKRVGRGKRLKYLAMFGRQLHVLVATGIPLTQALEALERQVKPGPWHDVLSDIRAHVEQGSPLSESMARHPGYFDPIVRSMIEAGEAGGNFAAMLDRVATLTRKQLHVRNAVIGAMIYPCLLTVVSVGVLITLLTFVLPRFADLFATLDTPLPPATKLLMAMSHLLVHYWWAFTAVIVGSPLAFRAYLASPGGKRSVSTALIRIPKFGSMVRNFLCARIIRALGTLLQSRVQLLDALKLTRQGTLNHHYADLLSRAELAVTRGEPISTAFARADLVPANIYEALRNGERSGQVGPLLLNMAEFMDEENEVILKSLTSILEPLILIVLGVFVGCVAAAMFLPLFDLTAATRGGG